MPDVSSIHVELVAEVSHFPLGQALQASVSPDQAGMAWVSLATASQPLPVASLSS